MKKGFGFLGLFPDVKRYSDIPVSHELSVVIELENLPEDNIVKHKVGFFGLSECYPKGYQLVSGEFPLNVFDENYMVGISIVKLNDTHFISDRVPARSVEGHEEARQCYLYFNDDPNIESRIPENLVITLYTTSKLDGTAQSHSEVYEGKFSLSESFQDGSVMETISIAASELFSKMKDNNIL